MSLETKPGTWDIIKDVLRIGRKKENKIDQPAETLTPNSEPSITPDQNSEPAQVQKTKPTPEQLVEVAEESKLNREKDNEELAKIREELNPEYQQEVTKTVEEQFKELLAQKTMIEEEIQKAGSQMEKTKEQAFANIQKQINNIISQHPDLKTKYSTLSSEKSEKKEFVSPETEKKYQQLVEDVIQAKFLLSLETSLGNIKRRKEKSPELADLVEIFGKDLKDYIESGIDEETFKTIIKNINYEKIEQKFTEEEKKEGKKTVKGIIKAILGGVGAIGGTLLVANPAVLTAFAGATLFGVGTSWLSHGVIEYFHGRNMEKNKECTRFEIEKNSWKAYAEMLKLAQDIKEGRKTDLQAKLDLVNLVNKTDKETLEKTTAWRKGEKLRKIAEVGGGLIFGAAGLVTGLLYAKGKALEEIMAKGLKFDFNQDTVKHLVKKSEAVKDGFIYLYNHAGDAVNEARIQIANSLGVKVTQLTTNQEKWAVELAKKVQKIAEGKFGGHLFKPETYESIKRAFENVFNAQYGKDLTNFIASGTVGILTNLTGFIGSDKYMKEVRPTAENKFLGEDVDPSSSTITLNNIDNYSGFIDEKTGKIATAINETREIFNKSAIKWEYPNYSVEERKIYEGHKDIINQFIKLGQGTEIEFIDLDSAITDLKIEKPKGVYYLYKMESDNNLIWIADSKSPREKEIKPLKLTDFIRHIEFPTKKFKIEETKKSSDVKTEKKEEKRTEEEIIKKVEK